MRRGPCGAARVSPRAGAGRGRGRGASAMARSRRPDAAPLARARRGRLLRDVLLRLGHTVLSGACLGGRRRSDADRARAGALLVLARMGAPVAAAAADRPRGRARDLGSCSALRASTPSVGQSFDHGEAVAVPLPHPSGVSRWMNDAREPAARRAGGRAHPRRARGAERRPGTGTANLLPTAIVTRKSSRMGDATAPKA